MYFKKALDQTPDYQKRAINSIMKFTKFMTNFIRINENAEITPGSERHRDLEYIYKINIFSGEITTLALNWDKVEASDKCRYEMDDQSEFQDTVETCSIPDFIKSHNKLIEKI